MDIKDIMGIKGDAKGAGGKKQKQVTEKKPEGVSREVWQIMKGQSGSDTLAPVVPTHAGLKDKRKVSTRKIAWSWQPFKNSARSDKLMLRHWVKTGTGGSILPGSNGGDVGGDYAFSKYNKKVDMLMYNDEEYESLIQPIESDWTRAETDHLFDLLNMFDLRFLVAHDRWGVGGGGDGEGEGDVELEVRDKKADDDKKDVEDADGKTKSTTFKPRLVEEMKSRYYEIARKLLEARADVPEEAAAHPIIKDPFNADAEHDRKVALSDQMERTNALEREEQAILDEVKAIEHRRRAEAQALSARAGAVFSAPRLEVIKASVSLEDLPTDQRAGAGVGGEGPPSLPIPVAPILPPGADPATAVGETPTELAPGAYARGKHVIDVAGQMAIAAVGTGGARGVKRIESLVEELGVKPPQVSTKAVCAAWLELRKEATELLELRKQLAKRQEELTGVTAACVEAAAASPAGAVAARVFADNGLPDTPRSKPYEVPLGPDGQPIGIRPAKRDQKRKMPARFADEGEEEAQPRRSAEKRAKR